jgi:HPt (histidine-containing phosphotransfer) domain-containing protein
MSDPGRPAAEQQMREQMQELSRKFLQRTAGQVATFREQLKQLALGDGSVLTSMQEVAHKIHGSGAVFGFEQISEHAGELELLSTELGKELSGAAPAAYADWAQRLGQHVEGIALALEAAGQANG